MSGVDLWSRRLAPAVVVLAVASGCPSQQHRAPSGAGVSTTAPSNPPGGGAAPHGYLVDQYGSPKLTSDVARYETVISGLPNRLTPDVARQLKAVNPHVQLFLYINGANLTPDAGPVALPESAYEHSGPGGPRCYPTAFPANRTMDPTSPEWIAFQVKRAIGLVQANPNIDGVFLDTLGPSLVGSTSPKGCPFDQGSSSRWTKSGWTAALDRGPARAVVDALHRMGRRVIGNGLGSANQYFSVRLAGLYTSGGLDGGVAEFWLRGPNVTLSAFPSPADFAQDIAMARDASGYGAFLPIVNMPGTCGSDRALKDQWRRMALAAFGLGNVNPESALAFTYAREPSCVAAPPHPSWDAQPLPADIASADRTASALSTSERSSLFTRTGANSFIAANLGTGPVQVALPTGSWCDLDGSPAGTTVPPRDALVTHRC